MNDIEEKTIGASTGEPSTDVQEASQNADIPDARVEEEATGTAAEEENEDA